MNVNTVNTTPTNSPVEINYHWEGDYLIPDIAVSEEETKLPPLTKWGMMRKNHLKNHHRIIYTDLKMAGKLFIHCHEIEEQANNRLEFMMKQLLTKSPPPDKNSDPMGWVAHMNALKFQIEEVIKTELIYN